MAEMQPQHAAFSSALSSAYGAETPASWTKDPVSALPALSRSLDDVRILGPSGAHLNQQQLQGDLVGPTGLAPTPQAGSQFSWYALVL
jgi:hypothetical protein